MERRKNRSGDRRRAADGRAAGRRGSSALVLSSLLLLAAAPSPAPPAAGPPLPTEPPAELAARALRQPLAARQALHRLGDALESGDPALAAAAESDLIAAGRAGQRALAAGASRSADDLLALRDLELVDADRFAREPDFRARVVSLLARGLDAATPPALRDDLLLALVQAPGFEFAAADEIEAAWGAAPRRSEARRLPLSQAPLFLDDDGTRPLVASIYSLPSAYFDAAAVIPFLRAVRALDARRTVLALTDLPLRRSLEAEARALDVHLLETYGRAYSPWPRDPWSFVRPRQGGLALLVRPNVQPGREEDFYLGRELVRDLPEAIDRAWGGLRFLESPVPFHNGQMLLTPDAIWISLHTLEPRILALLGLERVPVASFTTAAGLDRYLAAAASAAAELAALFGRPVRFVHPLPGGRGELADRAALMRRIGGGAGYDLDSLLALVPPPRQGAKPAALVADVAAGRELLAGLSATDLAALRRGYDLEPAADALAAALAAAQREPRGEALGDFLDLVAGQLAGAGFTVRRLPLLRVPTALLRDRRGLAHEEFLITYCNVVVEARGDGLRAEGFSSLLPAGDRLAREVFAAAGCRLDLLPPLVHSVVLDGGYRCASNHLRSPPRSSGSP